MRKWTLFLIFCVLSVFLFGSCSHTRTVTEYVPVEIDLTEAVAPVRLLRPDNSKMEIITDVRTVTDIVTNSLAYQSAWEQWQTYAEALELVIEDIQEVYGPKQ